MRQTVNIYTDATIAKLSRVIAHLTESMANNGDNAADYDARRTVYLAQCRVAGL